jgi:hypothetical protein
MGNVCACNKDTQADEIVIDNEAKPSNLQQLKDAVDTLEDECRVTIEFIPLTVSNPTLAFSLTAQSLARGWLGRQNFHQNSTRVEFNKTLQTLSRGFLSRSALNSIKQSNHFGLFPYLQGSIKDFTSLDLNSLESTKSGRILSTLKNCRLVQLSSNSIYQGEWSDDSRMPHGFGILKTDEGITFVGNFVQGTRSGLGWQHFPDGSLYEGAFSEDNFNGKGSLRLVEGRVISGIFVNGKLEGEGKETWDSGAFYEGNFVKSRKQGRGKMTIPKLSTYEGEFFKDKFEGVGKLEMENKSTYEGEWKKGMMHGKGIFTWPNGKVYNGEYQMDVKQGNGRMKYPNKTVYNGEWHNDLQHGKAIYTFFDKKKKEFKSYNSFWENGNRITFMKKDGTFFEVTE